MHGNADCSVVARLKAGVLAEPVLVGRERELEELARCLQVAVDGKGTAIFLSGEAGSGKTRLTNEFLNMAKKQGIVTLAGWCLSNAAVPYFPFFEAFNAFFTEKQEQKTIGSEEMEVTAWLMGPSHAEKIGKLQAISPQVWKDQTFAGVTKTLLAISARKPVILFIDDLHWADSASLALIHYIARATRTEKILLVATYRSEELKADAEGRPHPLMETLRLMKREDLIKEIKIPNLDPKGVSQLAGNMLGAALQPEFEGKLAEESQGNPLFVVESLRMLNERNGLFQENDRWRLTSNELGLPDKIKDIILQRLSCLLRNQRKIVDVASVIGEKFDAELLASTIGLDFTQVVEALEMISQTTSLIGYEESMYRFDHGRTREAVYGAIPPSLKRVYHGKIAEKLEAKMENGKLLLSEIAYHYANAENKEKAVKYALASGQDALARWSNVEAIKHFSYVLQAVADAPQNADAKLIALEGLGDAYYANSLFEKAIGMFEELAEFAMGSLKLRAYRKEMDAIWYKDFNPRRLMDLVKKAEPYAALDRLETARVRGFRGRAFHTSGNLKEALEDHQEALRVFEEEYSLSDAANLVVGVGFLHTTFSGLFEEGFSEILRGIAMMHELGDTLNEVHCCNIALANSFYLLKLFPEALNTYDFVIRTGEGIGDFKSVAMAFSRKGMIHEELGNFLEAVSQNLKSQAFSQKTDSEMPQLQNYADLIIEYSVLGDLDRAEDYYNKLMGATDKESHTLKPTTFIEFAKDILLFAKGKNEAIDRKFKLLLAAPSPLRRFIPDSRLGRLYAWYLDKQGRTEEAQAQLAEIQRLLEEPSTRFAHANIHANLMAKRQVEVDKDFEMRLDLVNVGRKSALLVEAKNVLFEGFEVSSSPSWCVVQNGNVRLGNRDIGPFKVETAKFTMKGLKLGTFTLNPQAVYVDDLGKTTTFILPPFTLTVTPPALKERVAGKIFSGTPELDRLLLGGIPENYTVVVTSSSTDERGQLIKRFLETGAAEGETTFHVATEAGYSKTLAEKYPLNFLLFFCNPQADVMIQNLPNIYKLKGVENLTDIDIALTKAIRTMNSSVTGPKRICIDMISDVLLQHHAVTTRRWLSALLPTLKTGGFTILAVIDPGMHPAEELQAVLGLFDGQISLYEKETPKGTARFLKVKRMTDQKYLKDEIALAEE